MCGITGFFGVNDATSLGQMVESLHHRGPDGHGDFISTEQFNGKHAHLGHARLAIVDVAGGHQPLKDSASNTVIVYNGEVYNHLEIRKQLIALGHSFTTSHSDTETVLRAFIEWGPDCFAKFNGMFALAIYDSKTRSIYLARDRFGEKPLFYFMNNQGFAFASELQALFHWKGFDASYNMANIQRFFAWGYMPAERTIYNNCYALEAGSWLRFDLNTSEISTKNYWSFSIETDNSLTIEKEDQLIEELRALLVQAVQSRLLSDVPLGLFLSGGIDSGTILAAASQLLPPEQVNAFTIGFNEPSFDESEKATIMAQAFGVSHKLEMLTLDSMRQNIMNILQRMSEPLGDASLIPTHSLCAFARKHVTVALSGDGGDELFAGYDPFLALKPASIYDKFMPAPAHALLLKMVSKLPNSDKNMSLDFKLKRSLKGMSYPAAQRIAVWMSPLTPAEIQDAFANPLSAEELYEDAINLWDKNAHLDITDQALMFFTKFYLSNDILVKVDRAAMMVSLESRAVFLDNNLVDFCSKLPHHFKLRGNTRKYLLKKALQGWLPESILNMPKKGFGIPLNGWLRELNHDIQTPPQMKNHCLQQMQAKHNARSGDYRLLLWAALAFEGMKKAEHV